MRVQVKRRCTIEGIEYLPGVIDMPDELQSHWFFLAQIQNGEFVLGEPKEETKILKSQSPTPGAEQIQISKGEKAFEEIKNKALSENILDESNKTNAADDKDAEDEDVSSGKETIIAPSKANVTQPATTKKNGK